MSKGNQTNKKYNIISIQGKELPYSSKIDCKEDEKGNYSIFIKETSANMQEDASDFESIIVWIWSVDRNRIVSLGYKSYMGENDKNPLNRGKQWNGLELKQPSFSGKDNIEYAEPARLHHMRFVYRVMRFRERYQGKGFILDKSNKEEIDRFEKLYKSALKNGELYITNPTEEGGIKGYDKKRDFLKAGIEITENHLEKWFELMSRTNRLPKQMEKVFGNNCLYDQLPCSMFIGEKSSSTRIFNSGYFDLWGINDKKELCVFELKKEGNEKLGIISELFFYAMLMKDMKLAAKGKYLSIRANHRGFKSFINCETKDVINAYFLVPRLHPSLEEEAVKKAFVDVLNEGDGVKFGVIFFDQKEIVKNDNFLRELINERKKLLETS